MAQSHGVVFECLVVYGYAERCADGILSAIAFTDRVFFIHLACEVESQTVLNLAGLFGEAVLFDKRKHGAFHRSESRGEVQHDTAVAPFELLVFVAAAEHAQEHTVYTD